MDASPNRQTGLNSKYKIKYLKFIKALAVIFFCCLFKLSGAYSVPYFIITKINIKGNKITKDKIINRELNFNVNDTILSAELNQKLLKAKENLLNTSLFNFVVIDTLTNDKNKLQININLTERWYIWPLPIAELSFRNFNSWIKDKEFSRVNYGFNVLWNNFRGRKENLYFLFRFGYDETYACSWIIPYIDKKQKIGLGFYGGITRNREVAYTSYENKLIYYKNTNNYPYTNYYGTFQISLRNNINITHYLQLQINNYIFNDTLLKLNNNYSFNQKKKISLPAIYYLAKWDFRDSKAYPLKGLYVDLEAKQDGFEQNKNLFNINSSYRQYWNLKKNYFLSMGFNSSYTSQKAPYFLNYPVGYKRHNIRGYDYYVINGSMFGIFKSNLKYQLIPQKEYKLNFIPTEKFSRIHYALYFNLFFDAAYVYEKNNLYNDKLINTFLYSNGVGIDFVTYYDKILRIEYSINKKKEAGIFINFIAPI